MKTFRDIVSEVSAATGICESRIRSRQRTARVVYCRDVAFWVGRETTPMTNAEMARAIGMDTNSVWHAIRRADERREWDAGFRELTDRLAAG